MKTLLFRSIVAMFAGLVIAGCAQPVEPIDSGESANHPPVIKSLTASPVRIVVGKWIVITAEAEDSDGDVLSYHWDATAGDIIGSGNEIRYTASYCCLGFNTVRLDVKDGRGGTATRKLDVQVFQ